MILAALQQEYASVEIYMDGRCNKVYFKIPEACAKVKDSKLFNELSHDLIRDIPRSDIPIVPDSVR